MHSENGHSTEQSKVLAELLSQLFRSMGVSQEREMRIIPAYLNVLKKYEYRTLLQTIMHIADTWQSDKIPTAQEIMQQFKLYKHHQQQGTRQENTEYEATTAASNFWKAFAQCRAEGITELNVIAKYLEKSVKSDIKQVSKCKNNFCDGNGFITATQKDNVLSCDCEMLFRCKCSNITDNIPVFNYQEGFTVLRGFNPELTHFNREV